MVTIFCAVGMMCAMVVVRGFEMGAAFSEEDQPDLAAHIEGGEHGGEEAENRDKVVDTAAFSVGKAYGSGKNGIFAHEAAGQRETGKGQGCKGEGCKGPWHVLAETTHPAHVLFVVHGVNDCAGSEEKTGFEKCVRHEVEERGGVGSDTKTEHHVAELGNGRVGQNTFDIVLRNGYSGCHERGEGADKGYDVQRVWSQKDKDTSNKVDTCGNHGGCMDKGGNGCRAFHGVRKPDMERKLR